MSPRRANSMRFSNSPMDERKGLLGPTDPGLGAGQLPGPDHLFLPLLPLDHEVLLPDLHPSISLAELHDPVVAVNCLAQIAKEKVPDKVPIGLARPFQRFVDRPGEELARSITRGGPVLGVALELFPVAAHEILVGDRGALNHEPSGLYAGQPDVAACHSFG